jgi:hypothetical protein
MKWLLCIALWLVPVMISYSLMTNDINAVFFDKEDIQIVTHCKKFILYQLDEIQLGKKINKKGNNYILNYSFKSKRVLNQVQYTSLLSALFDCNNIPSDVVRCRMESEFCVKLVDGKKELLLFFSKPGACDNYIKVVKINNISHEESSQMYTDEKFKFLF